MPNFGLEWTIPYFLYAAAIAAVLLSAFWRPIAGLYFLVPLIPLQTIRYRLNDFSMGSSVVYLILLGVMIGLLRKGKSVIPATWWTRLLCVYIVFTFVSLCLGSLYLNGPMPWSSGDPRLSDWADYMTMPVLFFAVTSSVTAMREVRILVVLMCIATLLLDKSYWNTVSGRDYSAYSDDLREGGAMGYAGSNGLAAFEAQISSLLVVLGASERSRIRRAGLWSLAVFSIVCLLYSLSRGGYLACAAGLAYLGIVRYRKLLLVIAVFAVTWTGLVPLAVVDRVQMTYDQNGGLDRSSELRVALWEDALDLLAVNPLLGTGYDTYRYMKRIQDYEDTHNIYLKVLVETGAIGLALFLAILSKAFWRGLQFSRHTAEPFASALGLGLSSWVVSAAVACLFGDRWTYFQIQGWLWVLAGLVTCCGRLQEPAESDETAVVFQPDAVLESVT